jgi:hypothetical protein
MPNLTGGAARKVGEKLIAAGLVKEILAKARAPVWRCDDANAQSYALKLTTARLKAIAVDPDGRQEGAAELKTPNGVNRSNADPRTPRKGQGRGTEAAQGRDGEGVQVHPSALTQTDGSA